MWVFLWVILSSILIIASVWSLRILLSQKKAWAAYAKSKNFTYNAGTFMGPAEMSGVIGDYKLSFFTAEREGGDVRTRRLMTALEINLTEPVADGCVMGTQEMLPFMQSLEYLKPMQLEHPGWEKNFFAFVRYEPVVRAYLTPERLDAYTAILGTKNADVLIIFNDTQLVLRLETSDPMQNADKIDKIVKRLLALCDKVRVTPEQYAQYSAKK
ncbi:MAG: hypothetical protein DI551_02650 [Micavibrio aeruginosavorus]|uniref:DUF3137 domain-containing protein n=1 Tax=Micavibrio aeruginosavorus TaxID=349221 RepID=A0A2W5N2Z8_9BACT|nr:MAG: hypothetical protein DI551_02650 [Micavibrio aeruginosavorus]